MPYFSCVMPTKNRANLIKETIDSIINQTLSDWELIIVDDHSTDNTEEIIKSIYDERIIYLKLDSGTGPGAARDFGIKKAKGDIIVLTDSDDLNKPDRLQILKQSFNNNIDIIYGDMETISQNEKEVQHSCMFNAELLKKYNYIFNPTSAFKKELYLNSKGYDFQLTTSEDYDLWLSFLELDARFLYLPQIMISRMIKEDSITKTVDYVLRKNNLAYVRVKHKLPIPNSEEVLNNPNLPDEIKKRIRSGKGIEFWFS